MVDAYSAKSNNDHTYVGWMLREGLDAFIFFFIHYPKVDHDSKSSGLLLPSTWTIACHRVDAREV